MDPSDTAIARAIVNPDTQQVSYVFNPKFTSENPFLFSNVIAHEALHSDTQVTTTEEVINLALQSSIYLEQLVKHTELATQGTELARRNNTNALARLNSGAGAELGLFASNGDQQILPGSVVPATSWFGQFENAPGFADTPGSPLLRQVLAKLRERGRLPSKPDFDMNTLNFIDQNSRNLSAQELVRAAKALKLQLP